MEQQEVLLGVATGKLRRLLAYEKLFRSTDVEIWDTAPLFMAVNRKSTPLYRGPAKISHIDDAGAAVKFQSQT